MLDDIYAIYPNVQILNPNHQFQYLMSAGQYIFTSLAQYIYEFFHTRGCEYIN